MQSEPRRSTGLQASRVICGPASVARSDSAWRPRSRSSSIRALHTRRGSSHCSPRSRMDGQSTIPNLTPATRHRLRPEGRPIDGLLLVDKPAGVTSHDVVNDARRALQTRRIGHAGTLDPFATGLLVLLVGHATRLLPYLNGEPKVYQATIAFGAETDTDDVTGSVTRTAELPDVSRVREAMHSLTGEIDQTPPAVSAKQVEGRRAYAAASRGESLALAPVRVAVHRWDVRELS